MYEDSLRLIGSLDGAKTRGQRAYPKHPEEAVMFKMALFFFGLIRHRLIGGFFLPIFTQLNYRARINTGTIPP